MRNILVIVSIFSLFICHDTALSAVVNEPVPTPAQKDSGTAISRTSTSSDATAGSGIAPLSDSLKVSSFTVSPVPRADKPVLPKAKNSLFAETIKMLIGLGITLGLIYGAAYLVKKISAQRFMGGTFANTQIRVLSTLNLPNKNSLFLIEVGGERMLLGASDGSVSLISKLEPGRDFNETLERTTRSTGAVS